MTGRNLSKPRQLCTVLAILVIASSGSSARADQPGARIIPAVEQKAPADAASVRSSELPLPYQPWQGEPLPRASARARDLPPPLARPRELPRRPFEVGGAFAAFLPSCSPGSIDDRGCATVSPGAGVEATLLYRVTPFFAVGGEAVLSGFAGRDGGALSSAGGDARFLGVTGRLYFAEAGRWDPYLSLSIGYGALTLREASGQRAATSGLGGRVSGGLDYVFGSRFRFGPTLGFAHWLAWSEASCQGALCRQERLSYGRLLGFATLGLRLTGSFGDLL